MISESTLTRATLDIMERWHQLESQWRDARAQEFQQRFISRLPDTAHAAQPLMRDLAAVLAKIRADCE